MNWVNFCTNFDWNQVDYLCLRIALGCFEPGSASGFPRKRELARICEHRRGNPGTDSAWFQAGKFWLCMRIARLNGHFPPKFSGIRNTTACIYALIFPLLNVIERIPNVILKNVTALKGSPVGKFYTWERIERNFSRSCMFENCT